MIELKKGDRVTCVKEDKFFGERIKPSEVVYTVSYVGAGGVQLEETGHTVWGMDTFKKVGE